MSKNRRFARRMLHTVFFHRETFLPQSLIAIPKLLSTALNAYFIVGNFATSA